jgi:hypothetical protein
MPPPRSAVRPDEPGACHLIITIDQAFARRTRVCPRAGISAAPTADARRGRSRAQPQAESFAKKLVSPRSQTYGTRLDSGFARAALIRDSKGAPKGALWAGIRR